MIKAKSRAEIQRAYRERLRQQNEEAMREKERQRWHQRRRQKKVKCIDDLSEREKRVIRRKWRYDRAEYRRKQKMISVSTPPSSDEDHRTRRGRAKLARNQRKAYRTIDKLSETLIKKTHSRDKYKRRWLRLRQMHLSSTTRSSCVMSDNENENTMLNDNADSSDSTIYSLNLSTTSQPTVSEPPHPELTKPDTSNSETKGHGNGLDQKTKELVESFYLRDDNSRIKTGKKETVTKNKIKMRKRLLLDSIINLHEKFGSEYPEENIGYATFTRLRPFWVRIPMAKDRDTCLCKKHENAQLQNDKLFQLGVVKFRCAEDFLQQVCCSTDNFRCMVSRECAKCHDHEVEFRGSAPSDTSVVVWFEWTISAQQYEKNGVQKTAKVTTKTAKRGTLKELKVLFSDTVKNVLAPHVYNIRHQFKVYKHLKETMETNEVVIHIDFSENYVCRNSSEIQSAHFGASNRQVTIHTGVMYKVGCHQSFASISPSLRHDPPAIWAHMQPILMRLRETHPEILDIHFFSDGPTTQYRNKQNFYFMSMLVHHMGFNSATWNFFESGHGKGAPDAIGGFLKRHADSRLNAGIDIPSAEELFKVLSQDDTRTALYYIEDDVINNLAAKCPADLKAIQGTMKLHQLITDEQFCVASRNLSCFCARPSTCTCFSLKRTCFKQLEATHVSIGI